MTLAPGALSAPRPFRDFGQAPTARESLRRVTGQVAVGFGWTAVALVLGFATKMLLTRRMAAADFGIVLAAQAFTSLLLVVAELGVPDAIVRYVGAGASPEAAPRKTVYAGIRIALVSALLTTGGSLVLLLLWSSSHMSSEATRATAILVVGLPLVAVGDVLGAAYRGVNRLGTKLFMIDVARPGIVAIAVLLSPVALVTSASYVTGLYVVGALVVLGALWIVFRRDRQWQDTSAGTSSELLRFGVPVAGAAVLAGPLVNGLLPMMLAAWTGSTAVAFYGIALALQGLAGLPLGIFEQVLVPFWARMTVRDSPAELARSYQQYAGICFAGVAVLGVVLIANDQAILSLLFGPDYAAAGSALQFAIVGTLFAAWAGPNEAMLRSIGASRAILAARIASAAAGSGSALALIPLYGLMGAMASFTLAVVALNVAYGSALYRAKRIHPFTSRHTITTVATLAAVLAATGLRGSYPVGGWVAAHALAIAILATNADLKSALGSVRNMVASQ